METKDRQLRKQMQYNVMVIWAVEARVNWLHKTNRLLYVSQERRNESFGSSQQQE